MGAKLNKMFYLYNIYIYIYIYIKFYIYICWREFKESERKIFEKIYKTIFLI